MARWQSRKEAAQARMRHHRGVTPPDEVRVMKAQYRIDRETSDALEAELEALKAEVEGAKLGKKAKAKPVAKKKVAAKVPKKVKKAKITKPKVGAEVEKPKGDYEQDFYEGGED